MRALIYSAIYGGFDRIKDQPEQTVPTDFVMYSDNAAFSKTWQVVRRRRGNRHPRMSAKYWKTHPPEGYDMTIWIDGSAQIKSPEFVEFLANYMDWEGVCAFAHPVRECIYDEAMYCYQMPKYRDQRILDQVANYRIDGYPEDNGLFACGMVVRKGGTDVFDRMWWRENVRRTWQDQLSFPYVAWKTKTDVRPLFMSQYQNPYIEFLTDQHKSNL